MQIPKMPLFSAMDFKSGARCVQNDDDEITVQSTIPARTRISRKLSPIKALENDWLRKFSRAGNIGPLSFC
jgi:hypothetical protein